jgi:DDE superfamily endonuclease
MPAHTSHRLQPLDVGCFSPLKHAYGLEIQELARQGVFHIDKEDFLLVYAKVRPSVLLEQNIKSGFLATGLVPYDPQRVLSLLPICQTPSPPSTANDSAPHWTSETPRTVAQLEQQARLIKDLLQRQSQSPSSQAINQLIKGCQMAMHSAVLLATENTKLQAANQRRKQKQQRRRRYIAQGGVLQAEQGQLLAQSLEDAEEEEAQREATQVRQRAPPTCSKCHTQGHNRRQCTTT